MLWCNQRNAILLDKHVNRSITERSQELLSCQTLYENNAMDGIINYEIVYTVYFWISKYQ